MIQGHRPLGGKSGRVGRGAPDWLTWLSQGANWAFGQHEIGRQLCCAVWTSVSGFVLTHADSYPRQVVSKPWETPLHCQQS